jgi:hypothetical protein
MTLVQTSLILASLLLAWRDHPSAGRTAEPEACALLTEMEVSAALEIKSLPGKRTVASSPRSCMWSDDPKIGVDHRRVTLGLTSISAFNGGKSFTGRITIEPAAGIGDDAYYEIFKSESPFLVARKGNVVINIRILNGLKLKGFTLEQEKAKEAELAKAALAKL